MNHDIELYKTGKLDANTASTMDTPAEIAEAIAQEAKHRALEVQTAMFREQVKAEAPGEFYVTVGYRSRPK